MEQDTEIVPLQEAPKKKCRWLFSVALAMAVLCVLGFAGGWWLSIGSGVLPLQALRATYAPNLSLHIPATLRRSDPSHPSLLGLGSRTVQQQTHKPAHRPDMLRPADQGEGVDVITEGSFASDADEGDDEGVDRKEEKKAKQQGAQLQPKAGEVGWNPIEFAKSLTVPQLRKYLQERGVSGLSKANQTVCMEALRKVEGEEAWAKYERELQAQPSANYKRMNLNTLRRQLIQRGVSHVTRMSREECITRLNELDANPLAALEYEKSAKQETEALPEPTAEILETLARREEYYSTLNVRELRAILRGRKETMYSELTREQCLERLRLGDRRGQPMLAIDPEPSPAPVSFLRRSLEALKPNDLKRIAREGGLVGYSQKSKGALVDLLLSYLEKPKRF